MPLLVWNTLTRAFMLKGSKDGSCRAMALLRGSMRQILPRACTTSWWFTLYVCGVFTWLMGAGVGRVGGGGEKVEGGGSQRSLRWWSLQKNSILGPLLSPRCRPSTPHPTRCLFFFFIIIMTSVVKSKSSLYQDTYSKKHPIISS